MESESDDTSARSRILEAAEALLRSGGAAAVTTRAVAAAAGVQAPTLYRLFQDKQGLLDATAEHGLWKYVAAKSTRQQSADPLENFRRAFDLHVAFGVDNPALHAILTAPRMPPASTSGTSLGVLRHFVRALAAAGRLRMEEARATALIQAVATGTVMTLNAMPPEARDMSLATTARETLIAAITATAPAPADAPEVAAITLRANLDTLTALSPGERQLMAEWLDRIAGADKLRSPRSPDISPSLRPA
ncbi:TetR/AcrR family transcriptional regulator [Pleomorphomonas sp. NRK KF1]|uniref:TetR/AcrR family transcriptional regulator n=1 Tax=Pleomorphomonas sp. NRK KF1 TaxID=2943000 RepID=UPI0020435DAC|nr:TetR/AcrR family transcriptional regulator [Pleomorphomonas sp. NRK KF1]MCM5554092.1 TetR/AcrR family transcriptional regulator [Pleomorphomonas sp. NRK KF1]